MTSCITSPGSTPCYFIKATKCHSHNSSCQDRARPAVDSDPPQQQVLYQEEKCWENCRSLGSPGKVAEGPGTSLHSRTQLQPWEKHFLSFLQDFCHFPAKTPPHSRSQDCLAFNHARGTSLGVRQGGWRWLLSQIPALKSVLAQGTHLRVIPWLSQSLPASRSPQSRTSQCPPTCVGSFSSLQGPFRERTSSVDPQPCCHQHMHHSPLRFSNPHLPESCA